jgi:hypothetical protein
LETVAAPIVYRQGAGQGGLCILKERGPVPLRLTADTRKGMSEREDLWGVTSMIRKLKSGYRLYSRKKNPKTGKRRNLGTFKTRAAAKKHEKAVQYFKRQ